MQKNKKPTVECDHIPKKRIGKREYIIEKRNTKPWSYNLLDDLFKYMSEWHKFRSYVSLKQAETALDALNKKGRGWEYRLREF